MNFRGQLDQTITSVMVLFAVVFLMLIFTYATSGLRIFNSHDGVVLHDNSARKEAASLALLHTFLSDTIVFQGEKVSVLDALDNVSKAVYDHRINDAAALSMLNLNKWNFESVYGCERKNSLTFLVKNPSGSAQRGSYLILIDYPSESSSISRLDSPIAEVNIINFVNDFVSNPKTYDSSKLAFVSGLYDSHKYEYGVYPASDVLNEEPNFIVLAKGELEC